MAERREEEFYTVAEAARVLQVSHSTVWRWIEARKLPAYRVGHRAIRIRRRDLEEVIRPVAWQKATKDLPLREEKPDIWKGYDSEKVRVALRAGAGILKGIDLDAMKVDIRAARGQDSAGRPA